MDIDTTTNMLDELAGQALNYHFPFSILGSVMQKDIDRYGDYSEPGFEFTKEDVQLSRLYAGLTLLIKNMYDNVDRSCVGEIFTNVINDVNAEDSKRYHSEAFPYNHPDFKFKTDLHQILHFVEEYSHYKQPDLERILKHDEFNHEWIVKSGKKLFRRFLFYLNSSMRTFVCDKDGIYDKLKQNGDGVQLIVALATILITKLSITNSDVAPLGCIAFNNFDQTGTPSLLSSIKLIMNRKASTNE